MCGGRFRLGRMGPTTFQFQWPESSLGLAASTAEQAEVHEVISVPVQEENRIEGLPPATHLVILSTC